MLDLHFKISECEPYFTRALFFSIYASSSLRPYLFESTTLSRPWQLATLPRYVSRLFLLFNMLYWIPRSVWGTHAYCKDLCLFLLQWFGLWNLCSLQGLFGVLTLQSIWGAHSCWQGLILIEVTRAHLYWILRCPLNA